MSVSYQKSWKRLIDIVLATLGLIFASWLYLLIAVAVWIDDPGPIFFTQKRVGVHKRLFTMHKFRSMKTFAPPDVPTHLLENPEKYITRVGHFLRRTSLDEIPQLWDILVGNMSVIGPRPALWNQTELIEAREACGANNVRPGLSGWAQINGREKLTDEEKVRFDGEYVKKISFLFDCRCFFGTVTQMLCRNDG